MPQPGNVGALCLPQIDKEATVINDFTPPSPARKRPIERLFTTKVTQRLVQSVAERHEYKKEQGSSDSSHTYDSIKI